MRIQWLAALAALAILGGCNGTDQQAAGKAGATNGVAAGNTITAQVLLHDPMTIGAGAKLSTRLIDSALPDAPLAEKTFDVSGNPPFNFSLDCARARVEPSRTYEVRAVLIAGSIVLTGEAISFAESEGWKA